MRRVFQVVKNEENEKESAKSRPNLESNVTK